MVIEHQSKEVVDKISRDLKSQPALDLPKKLDDKINLSFNVNPDREIKVKTGTATDATATTVHTTHSTKETYLIGATMTITKDVNSTSVQTNLAVVPFGSVSTIFLIRRYEPTTAGSFEHGVSLKYPLKLAKGSAITINNSTAIASIDASATIYYYEVDPQ